jgi:predicted amidophosphoribosyltransferase
MPIIVCEYCGKPFNNAGVKLCPSCSKDIEEAYIKARRYIYQNPKTCDFISIVEETEIPEKALSYLINKGRIVIADKTAGGLKCRACGKETDGGSLCESCMAKIMKEKLTNQQNKKEAEKPTPDTSKKVNPLYVKNENG